MRRVDYDERQHENYHRGRVYSPDLLDQWMAELRRHRSSANRILDLGSGTGRFSPALAKHYGAEVVGVDPSAKMRAVAEEKSPHSSVTYVHGEAARIPLPDSSQDLAFMSMVLHHVPDHAALARELRRVLASGGHVFVRSCFRGRLEGIPLYRFFQACRRVDEKRMPDLVEMEHLFGQHGFRMKSLVTVRQVIDATLRDHFERLKLGAVSTFELVSQAELDEGFAALDRAAEADDAPSPVTEDIDLLVLVKDG